MLRGLWKLTWIEMKIFVREPLGLFGTLGMPVIVFFILSRVLGGRAASQPAGSGAHRRRRSADFRGAADRDRRGAVAGHDHLDLP